MSDTGLRALIVDEPGDHTDHLESLLTAQGFVCDVAESLGDARARLLAHDYRVAFVVLDCGGEDCLELLEEGLLDDVDELLLMNDVDDPDRVRRGIAAGATYFSCKPFDAHLVTTLLRDLMAERSDRDDLPDSRSTCAVQFGLLRGDSPPMRRLYRIIRKVAQTSANVFIVGASGTGKELVARTLHQMSDRADQPFLAINCGAIVKELFESELFGHEKGSFSGASRRHAGFFERADKGILFLDEITEMPLELQVKLLRILESGSFRRVGGEVDLSSDVRIIAACNRDPADAIAQGSFREDLYYRVASFPIKLPPLRDRGDDIIGLAHYFLGELGEESGVHKTLSDDAIERLGSYEWPGNVRELIAVIERAYVLANDTIESRHLIGIEKSMPDAGAAKNGYLRIALGDSIGDAERKLIFATLQANGGDKKRAAKTLGVSLKTLYNRLNEYDESCRDQQS